MESANPSLGSKVNLISKANIRYEGILCMVDPNECTITLSSVRSFGTEDRETNIYIAAQNQIYEYILFRGADIKDVRVGNSLESRKFPDDPAIVDIKELDNQLASYAVKNLIMHGPAFAAPVGSIIPTSLGVRPRSSVSSEAASNKVDIGIQVGDDLLPSRNIDNCSKPAIHQNNYMQPRSLLVNNMPSNLDGPHTIDVQYNAQTHRDFRNFDHNERFYGDAGNRNWGRHRFGNHSVPNNQISAVGPNRSTQDYCRMPGFPPNKVTGRKVAHFEEDYDFEQANYKFEQMLSKLSKLNINQDLNNVDLDNSEQNNNFMKQMNENDSKNYNNNNTEGLTTGYDKSKSFFDNISCEACPRINRKYDWREQRKINTQTFGMTSTRNINYFYNEYSHYPNGYFSGAAAAYTHVPASGVHRFRPASHGRGRGRGRGGGGGGGSGGGGGGGGDGRENGITNKISDTEIVNIIDKSSASKTKEWSTEDTENDDLSTASTDTKSACVEACPDLKTL